LFDDYHYQVTKDIEDAEHFLDNVNLKSDVGALDSDPEQLALKLAEEEVGLNLKRIILF